MNRSNQTGAFTLVELMASIAVLVLILALLGQVAQNTMSATNASKKQMAATREARVALDAIRDDLDAMVMEQEAATLCVKANGANTDLLFVVRRRVPSGYPDVRFQAVRYTLAGTRLVREVRPIEWVQSDLMEEAFKVYGNSDPDLSSVVAEGILRFEAAALLVDGNLVAPTDVGSWSTTTWHESPIPVAGLRAMKLSSDPAMAGENVVSALAVAVAALDPQSLKLPLADSMGAALPSPPPGRTPQEAWNSAIESGVLASGYPAPAVRSLTIRQKTLWLR